MRLVPRRKIVIAGILAGVTCGLLIANFLPASVPSPKAGVLAVEATVGPFAMMSQASPNLPVEQYDSH
jgi:hypothetical protein